MSETMMRPPVPLGALSEELAATSLALARRFSGRASMWCASPRWPHHALHVSVEFVYPVIVGKRALPAFMVPGDLLVPTLGVSARPGDILVCLADGDDASIRDVIRYSRGRRLLTLWIGAGSHPEPGLADCLLWLPEAGPLERSEQLILVYHLLWELTHVCLEHPGLMREQSPAAGATTGANGHPTDFLYPFIEGSEEDEGPLLADLARSAAAKMAESGSLRAATLEALAPEVTTAATAMAERWDLGGRLFVFGNGGSATDSAALATLFSQPPLGEPLPAHSLAAETAVLTALANDVGFDRVFARQLMAHGTSRDIALGVSTSGNSDNVIAAFVEAKRRGMLTVGLAGYGGGQMAGCDELDHCLVVRSDSVHRIQETQAALGRALWSGVQQCRSGGRGA